YPDIQIFLKVVDDTYVTMLEENIIDMAFILDVPLVNSSVNTIVEIKEEIGLFSTLEHSLSKKKKVVLNDVSNIPMLLTTKECCYRKLFEEELKQKEITPKMILETSNLQAIKEMTINGVGICLLPQLAVEKEIEEKKLIKLAYTTNYKISSQLIMHKDKWISPILKNFLDIIKVFSEEFEK
ncbi:MAG: LysR family transcriptional regulator substrate-binding protein, partial [Coprobacillaceae bacterium]